MASTFRQSQLLCRLFLLLLLAVCGGVSQAAQEGGEAENDNQWHGVRRAATATTKQQRRCSSNLPSRINSNHLIQLRRSGKLNREYRIQTPSNYDPTRPSKILLAFHGWGEDSTSYTNPEWLQAADEFNYIVVMPEGIQESWQFPGSSDGYGRDGTSVVTCNLQMNAPDYCYEGCACPTRCGWTHCQDDDVEFVVDLLRDLPNHVCVDDNRIYSTGISNGGMLTWTLGQDPRVASLLAGIAPMIAVPHYDYSRGKATSSNLPVLGIYGTYDTVVPPGNNQQNVVQDSAGYYWIPAHRLHNTWASDHGCRVQNEDGPAPFGYSIGDNIPLQGDAVECRTHCSQGIPYSVDCRAEMGHETPLWMMHLAFRFFEQHYQQRVYIAQQQQRGNRNIGNDNNQDITDMDKVLSPEEPSQSHAAPSDHFFD